MDQDAAQEILTEVRELGTRLDAKMDGVREDLLVRFDQLHAATEFNHDSLAKKIDALEVEIVRSSGKRR